LRTAVTSAAAVACFAFAACGGAKAAPSGTTPTAPAPGPIVHFGDYEVPVPAGYSGNDEGQPSIINMLSKGDDVDAVVVLIASPRRIPNGDDACVGFAQGVPEGYMSEVKKAEVKIDVTASRKIDAHEGVEGGCQIDGHASSGDEQGTDHHIVSTALRAPAGDVAILCFFHGDDPAALAACHAVVGSIRPTKK
jgi:hypothetical protein